MLYSYEAKDTTGQTVSGALEADSERVAATLVRDMGFFPLRLRPAGPQVATATATKTARLFEPEVIDLDTVLVKQKFPLKEMLLRALVYPIRTGVGLRDLAIFFRQMSAMLGAGVPILRTLDSVRESTSGSLLRKIIQTMHMHVQAGGQLSEAMARYPYVFTDMHREFVATAESTGHMPEIFTRLADYCEQEYALRQMVKRETFQTKLTLVASVFIPGLPILVLQGSHAYLQSLMQTFDIAGCLFGAWIGYRLLMQTRVFSVILDTIKSYIPYFGSTVRMLAIAKFARAFSALYSAGVLIPSALDISAKVSGNAYLGSLIARAGKAIRAGEGLTESLARSGVFPPMMISMVSTGEQTGSLDKMLDKVAEFYEGESEARLHKSAIALTQLFFMLVALKCAIEIIGFYTGYASEIDKAGNTGDGN